MTPLNAGAAMPASVTRVRTLGRVGRSTTCQIRAAMAATLVTIPKQQPVRVHDRQPIAGIPAAIRRVPQDARDGQRRRIRVNR